MPRKTTLIFVLLIILPYLSATIAAGADYQFGGFLQNPKDGNSYLAKMYQGYRGDWQFTLPFTSEPGEGAFLYTFYLALGHISRFLNIPLILLYHLARIAAAVFMGWMIWRYLETLLLASRTRTLVFAVTLLGAGMGWLVLPFNIFTSDFWVAEAFPFLSASTNPHFCLSLALMLWLIMKGRRSKEIVIQTHNNHVLEALLVVFLSALLTSISPFSLIIAVGVLLGELIWELLSTLQSQRSTTLGLLRQYLFEEAATKGVFLHVVWIILGSAPVALSALLAIQNNTALSIWTAQNITMTPPVWDLLIAFSPALFFAIPGIFAVVKSQDRCARSALFWFALASLLVYAPFNLQRRMLTGLFIPVAALAGYGLDLLVASKKFHPKWLHLSLLALSLPTTALTLLIQQTLVINRVPLIYLERREAQALKWIEENTSDHSLVLASPRLGLFIPAHTGRRVIYGHEFETVRAEQEEKAVIKFFEDVSSDKSAAEEFLDQRRVDYVLYIPSQHYSEELEQIQALQLVYDYDATLIFRVRNR